MYDHVITVPGQGAHRPGMLDSWLASAPYARELLADWSESAGLDLLEAGRDAAAMADTAVAQPLITAAALLSLKRLRARLDVDPGRVLYAGHSVGELAAAAGAGYLPPGAAVALARERGKAMSAACATAPTGMAACMPSKRDGAADEAIVDAIRAGGLSVANWNGSHQFVAAGPSAAVEAFGANPPAGMRVVRLEVAGAFHTEAMAPALEPFARAVARAPWRAPDSAMLGNADGSLVTGPDDLRQRLVAQLTSAVRWDLCAESIARHSSARTLHVELAPAGPLTKLAERARPWTRTVALRSADDLDAVPALAGSGA
ncbi:ACP S-malonyltransferase [Streptomyces sp. CBMA156]|uniref:ACP S-malonyltransferase n=1 Tax=Streptomyces sp. CBMA156 TaxID=1930280 RepID=UPI001661ABA7|nr:ACP S-malonyltransferase [Streptomyces sp. CBMA156]MBD0670562.1 malonyl CoA-ACP transacylase [Streptomyces sp. CBMA156]MBD0676480.1 malonyl CoA-ACP transacylase [Streptomyces sp. CBMA156]